MSQADELLESLSVADHLHQVIDSDVPFSVDPIARKITNESSPLKNILIQGDHNSERFTFKIHRYIEGHDMALCDIARVCFINVSTELDEDGKAKFEDGVYTMHDLKIVDDRFVTCSWDVKRSSVTYEGHLHFALIFMCMERKKITYRWGTRFFEDIFVAKGPDSDLQFESRYCDVIEQWKEAVKTEFSEYIDAEVAEQVDIVQIGKNKENIDQMMSELAVQKARMDNFTTLSEGSTTGDAELGDMRVGADGDRYENAGTALRSEVLKYNRIIGLYHGFLKIDYVNAKAYLVRTDGVDNNVQIVTEFGALQGSNNSYTFDTDTLDLITARSSFLIINTQLSKFYNISCGDYKRVNGDIILCGVSDGVVYPFQLSGTAIEFNGYMLIDNSYGLKISELTNKIYNSYDLKHFVIWNNKLLVNRGTGTITLPVCYYSYFPVFTSVINLPTELTVTWPTTSGEILRYIVFNTANLSLTLEERNFNFTKYDVCIGGVMNDMFVPVEIMSNCVEYVGEEFEKMRTVEDFFTGLINNNETFKIVLGGDSITHGVGGTGWAQTGDIIIKTSSRTWKRSPDSYCWAKLFKDYIEGNYNATVTNNACTGTASGWWNSYKSQLIPADTDLFIFTIGTNDRNENDDGGSTREEQLESYESNIRSIIDYCHSNGISILLCSPIPASKDNEDQEVHLASCFEMNSVIHKVCGEYNMPFVNMYNEVFYYMLDRDLDYESYLPDGLHPGDALYKIMFYRLLKATGLAPHYEKVK